MAIRTTSSGVSICARLNNMILLHPFRRAWKIIRPCTIASAKAWSFLAGCQIGQEISRCLGAGHFAELGCEGGDAGHRFGIAPPSAVSMPKNHFPWWSLRSALDWMMIAPHKAGSSAGRDWKLCRRGTPTLPGRHFLAKLEKPTLTAFETVSCKPQISQIITDFDE